MDLQPFLRGKTLPKKQPPPDPNEDQPLPTFCRFRDLSDAGLVSSWVQLKRLIDDEGFPSGFKLSANIRVWDVAAVRAWIEAKQQGQAA